MSTCVRCGQRKHPDDYLYQAPGGSGASTAYCRRYVRRAPWWLRWFTGSHHQAR